MKISQYVVDYTSGEFVFFRYVLLEVKELWDEVVHWNKAGMAEEWEDVLHFFQLWLYWRFKVDGEVWHCTRHSVEKFMNRVQVWHDIYEAAGLPRKSSNFAGNYKKIEKVVKQLGKLGVSKEKAELAYNTIVLKQI